MEDIIEEFGSGLLALATGIFFMAIWMGCMKPEGMLYEFVQQFLNVICGG